MASVTVSPLEALPCELIEMVQAPLDDNDALSMSLVSRTLSAKVNMFIADRYRESDRWGDRFVHLGDEYLADLLTISQHPFLSSALKNLWIMPGRPWIHDTIKYDSSDNEYKMSMTAQVHEFEQSPETFYLLKQIFDNFRTMGGDRLKNIFIFSSYEPILRVLDACGFDRPLVTLGLESGGDEVNHPGRKITPPLAATSKLVRGLAMDAPCGTEWPVPYFEPQVMTYVEDTTNISTENVLECTTHVGELWIQGYCNDNNNDKLFPSYFSRKLYPNLHKLKLGSLTIDCSDLNNFLKGSSTLAECHLYDVWLTSGPWTTTFEILSGMKKLDYLCINYLMQEAKHTCETTEDSEDEQEAQYTYGYAPDILTALLVGYSTSVLSISLNWRAVSMPEAFDHYFLDDCTPCFQISTSGRHHMGFWDPPVTWETRHKLDHCIWVE